MRESLGRASCLAMLLSACMSQDAAGLADSGADDGVFSETSGPESFTQMPARDIEIREIEINQGTRVVIGTAGDWLDLDQRALGLIASRDSLLRVHHAVGPDWIARDIEARLTLEYPDGTSEVLSMIQPIAGNSTPDSLEGGFWFSIGAGQADPQTEYRVELWEAQDQVGDDLPELAWANPAAGTQPIGFEAVALEMKVVIVPIHYASLDKTPALDDEAIAELIDDLYEQNPTNRIIHELHEPVEYGEQLNDLGELLPLLSQLKVADEADANTYYHGLVDIGAPTLGGIRGIGNIVGPTEDEGPMRVAATLYWGGDTSLAAETFTHEIGHNQGLEHVSCPNVEADGLAAGYPYQDGVIGSWGAGVRRLEVFGPDTAYDYMSYCGPSWVSDWTWLQTRERIATLTAWDYRAKAEPSDAAVLIGALGGDGTTQWWTAPGRVEPERAGSEHRLTFVSDEGEVVERAAQIHMLSDGVTIWIRAELPFAFDRIAAIRHQRDAASVEIPIDAVVTDYWTH